MIDQSEVKQRIAIFLRRPVHELDDQTALMHLVTDSFLLVEMVVELQEELKVRLLQDDLKDVKTVGDLVLQLSQRLVQS